MQAEKWGVLFYIGITREIWESDIDVGKMEGSVIFESEIINWIVEDGDWEMAMRGFVCV